MSQLDIQSLFNSHSLNLPYLEEDDNKSFLFHYKTRMSLYIDELKKVDEDSFSTFSSKTDFIDFIEHKVIDKFIHVLEVYLSGFPSKAYQLFKVFINDADLQNELLSLRTISIAPDHYFYRIKKEYDHSNIKFNGIANGINNIIKPVDLFHVPFERRKVIGTCRYSIPGFPCMYLSDSLYSSWSECLQNENEAFHAIAFKNHRPLYMVDITPLNFTKGKTSDRILAEYRSQNQDTTDTFLTYAIVYPIITACHSKIKYKPTFPGEIQFKSEYIIPQLLLQWYREDQSAESGYYEGKMIVDGIRYLSCTAEERFPNMSISKFNYVVPAVNSDVEIGYCNSLLKTYSATSVYSFFSNNGNLSVDEVVDEAIAELNRQSFLPLI